MVASCSPLAPQPDRSKFFMLSPLSAAGDTGATPKPLADQIAIGVGPIDFPDYLRRHEVVTRTAPNRIDVSEQNRWAGPLDKNFASVLSENLAALLGTQRVENYPWNRNVNVDYQVVVDVERFDTSPDGQASLIARWSIKSGRDGKDLYATQTTTNSKVGSGDDGTSAALSSNLAELSREIASEVNRLSQQRGRGFNSPSGAKELRPESE